MLDVLILPNNIINETAMMIPGMKTKECKQFDDDDEETYDGQVNIFKDITSN